jgi:hypothetical protein
MLKSRGIVLEVCPLSNYLTNCVESIESHPINRLVDAGELLFAARCLVQHNWLLASQV